MGKLAPVGRSRDPIGATNARGCLHKLLAARIQLTDDAGRLLSAASAQTQGTPAEYILLQPLHVSYLLPVDGLQGAVVSRYSGPT